MFLSGYLTNLLSMAKGENLQYSFNLSEHFIEVESKACGKLKPCGQPARKILTSDWLGAERGSNRSVQKTNRRK